jgi:hypothetical protein
MQTLWRGRTSAPELSPPHTISHMQQILRSRQEPATAVAAAAALIELAMNESQGPVAELSAALARMARVAEVAPDLALCIEALQFHDRLIQQLTQVRNLLATLAASGSAGAPPFDPQSWHVLLENLRARFTSDSHRILFNLLLPSSGGRGSTPSLHANEGSIELF